VAIKSHESIERTVGGVLESGVLIARRDNLSQANLGHARPVRLRRARPIFGSASTAEHRSAERTLWRPVGAVDSGLLFSFGDISAGPGPPGRPGPRA